jgi:hypothetical protein
LRAITIARNPDCNQFAGDTQAQPAASASDDHVTHCGAPTFPIQPIASMGTKLMAAGTLCECKLSAAKLQNVALIAVSAVSVAAFEHHIGDDKRTRDGTFLRLHQRHATRDGD